MTQEIKTVELVDLTDKPKLVVSDGPTPPSTTRKIEVGGKVLVQTPNSQNHDFYIMLEVVEQTEQDQYVGKVIGPEGYEGPGDIIYPGPYFKFDFDGLKCDDLIYFNEINVA